MGEVFRERLYSCILIHPGMHFRELLRYCHSSLGQMSYHLHKLEQSGVVVGVHGQGYVRYFSNDFDESQRHILCALRNKNSRKMLLLLLENKTLTNREIAVHLHLSPSTVSWYVHRLEDTGILLKKDGHYVLVNGTDVEAMFTSYKESFTDTLVNRFIESWEE